MNSFDKMQLTLWLDVSWDIDNGWLAFLGSDPKDDNDATDSDAGLGITLKGKKDFYENILFQKSHLYELFLSELAAMFERSFVAVRSVSLLTTIERISQMSIQFELVYAF